MSVNVSRCQLEILSRVWYNYNGEKHIEIQAHSGKPGGLFLYPKGGGYVPKRPKKPCGYPGCPNLTDGRYCEEHTTIMNQRYNKYERPYKSSERYGGAWRLIRNRYIRAHPLCEKCLEDGRFTPAKEVHHILPLKHGGTHSEDNLMALCKSCHSRITAESGDRWQR